jgi:hypothetical protein
MIKWISAVLDSKASPCFGRVACAVIITVHLVVFCLGLEKDLPWGWVSAIAVLFGGANAKEIAAIRRASGH